MDQERNMKKLSKTKQRKSLGKKAARGRTLKASTEEWAAPDEKMYKPIKKPVTLRLDADVLGWFKTQGRGYQTRINRALRGVMAKERKAAG
jgi:uncharacterized protein (DUF4415 family)